MCIQLVRCRLRPVFVGRLTNTTYYSYSCMHRAYAYSVYSRQHCTWYTLFPLHWQNALDVPIHWKIRHGKKKSSHRMDINFHVIAFCLLSWTAFCLYLSVISYVCVRAVFISHYFISRFARHITYWYKIKLILVALSTHLCEKKNCEFKNRFTKSMIARKALLNSNTLTFTLARTDR